MNIGIFGGSFNPIHKGHLAIAKEAIKELNLDKLFFVPNFKSPFKTSIKYADPEHRVAMIDLVKPNKSEVSKFEINRKGISYTFETVDYFKQKFPNDNLYLIIGSDNLYKLHKWKNINDIVSKVKIAVFRREGDFSKINVKKYDAILFKNDLYKYSSTDFKKGLLDNVEKKVREYISKNYLYLNELIMNNLSVKRYKHSVAVAVVAAKYAKELSLDPKAAWVSGMLHDIFKEKSNQELIEFIKRYQEVDVKPYNYHSLAGALWAKEVYGIKNQDIIEGIKRHTSLREDATDFERVIYAADKLADGRRWEGIQKVREAILKDFNKGFKLLIKHMITFFEDNKIKLDEDTIKGFERWK